MRPGGQGGGPGADGGGPGGPGSLGSRAEGREGGWANVFLFARLQLPEGQQACKDRVASDKQKVDVTRWPWPPCSIPQGVRGAGQGDLGVCSWAASREKLSHAMGSEPLCVTELEGGARGCGSKWYHFGGFSPILEPILVGDWDLHWGKRPGF